VIVDRSDRRLLRNTFKIKSMNAKLKKVTVEG